MYGIFTNMRPKNHPNVGKYARHGAYGIYDGHIRNEMGLYKIATDNRGCRILVPKSGSNYEELTSQPLHIVRYLNIVYTLFLTIKIY